MPNFIDTIADDFQVPAADFGETVTYTSRSGSSDSVAGAAALTISKREVAASEGFYHLDDLVFLLPRSELALTPEEGAQITRPDATNWRLIEVRQEVATQQWRCVGRKER